MAAYVPEIDEGILFPMRNDGRQHVKLPYYCNMKVHGLMCLKLKNFIDRISQIYLGIESARPRCSSGIQAICLLHLAIDKANLLIQHCSESSKLYLAVTADNILLRCKKIQNSLDLYLFQIHNMVPSLLAAKISGIIEDLRGVNFSLESSEEEAGKVLLALLRQDISLSSSVNNSELETLQLAALRLKITSPVAVLVEKRSIKRMIGTVHDKNPAKKKILNYLLHLLRKYGELLGGLQNEGSPAQPEEESFQPIDSESHMNTTWDEGQADDSGTPIPPEEFKCPISMRLMYDPVIIASGKTYERVWIEKLFNEGHRTCPITKIWLDDLALTPNFAMKSLISNWCSRHGVAISDPCAQSVPAPTSFQKVLSARSIASFGSSMNDLRLEVSNASLRSSDTNSCSDLLDDNNNIGFKIGLPQISADCICHSSRSVQSIIVNCLSRLASLPWGSQCDAVQDVKEKLNKNEQACDLMFPQYFMQSLTKFLKDARDLCDLKAQKDSMEVFLAIQSKRRIEIPSFDDETIYMLVSFLDSEVADKAFAIMELLSCQQCYKPALVATGVLPSILKVLNTQTREFHEIAMKILYNLSCNSGIAYHIVYLDCIPKLVPFLGDRSLAGYCLKIMMSMCDIEEGRIAAGKNNSCVTSIAKLLETGTEQEQDTALEVLLSICYENVEHCQPLLGQTAIQYLFSISNDKDSKRKIMATELLQLLGYITESSVSDCSCQNANLSLDMSSDSGDHPHQGKNSLSTAFGYLGRKISRFLHHRH